MMSNTANTQPHRLLQDRRGTVFFVIYLVSCVVLAWLLFTQPPGFDSPAAPAVLVALLACTFVFLRWIANPVPAALVETTTRKDRLALTVFGAGAVMFVTPMLFEARVLYALPVLAVIILLILRRPITRREWCYALALALVAALAGLGSGWIQDFSPPGWAALQLALVSTSLLCGWKVFQLSYLCQYRDLETAVGFHFMIDFVRFLAAFMAFQFGAVG